MGGYEPEVFGKIRNLAVRTGIKIPDKFEVLLGVSNSISFRCQDGHFVHILSELIRTFSPEKLHRRLWKLDS